MTGETCDSLSFGWIVSPEMRRMPGLAGRSLSTPNAGSQGPDVSSGAMHPALSPYRAVRRRGTEGRSKGHACGRRRSFEHGLGPDSGRRPAYRAGRGAAYVAADDAKSGCKASKVIWNARRAIPFLTVASVLGALPPPLRERAA